MRVAITFRDQPEHERRDNEYDYSSFSRREAKSLPHLIELKTPALFNHKLFQHSATESNFGFQPELSCRLPSLRVLKQARIPVRPDRHGACVTTQTARRNVPARNENSSRQFDDFCCI